MGAMSTRTQFNVLVELYARLQDWDTMSVEQYDSLCDAIIDLQIEVGIQHVRDEHYLPSMDSDPYIVVFERLEGEQL